MKSEPKAWLVLSGAVLLGMVASVSTSGCLSAHADELINVNAAVDVDDPNAIIEAGGDWPQWGGTRLRNNTPTATNMPTEWNPGKFDRKTGAWDKSKSKNVKWVAQLGSQTYGNPVIADGQVYVGTNNTAAYVKRYPDSVDLGVLLCFAENDGRFLWQHSSEKLPTGRVHDWPLQGICSTPLIEGERMWFVTSRGEVRCLDTKGFYDDEDDGPMQKEVFRVLDVERADKNFAAIVAALDKGQLSPELQELLASRGEAPASPPQVEVVEAGKKWSLKGTFDGAERTLTAMIAGPRLTINKVAMIDDKEEADVVWSVDLMADLGVSQHNMCSCSITSYGDLIFVCTSNGVDESHINIPTPDAPSFVCMDKTTGKVYWTDKSPGTNILHGQWSSPMVEVFDGVPQVLFCGGDGWVYSFRADKGSDGNPELLWKFDANPKESIYVLGSTATRNHLIGTPIPYKGRVYIAVGEDPEHGEGDGHLWCIDPTKRGDISPQLAVRVEGAKRVPIPHKRLKAVEPEKGEAAIDNPNSGVIWHYTRGDWDGNGEIEFHEEMHRTLGSVAIKDDRLYIADLSGVFHCLDAMGTPDGEPKHIYSYDMLAQSWGSPLIVDDKVYIGDEDGDIAIFDHHDDSAEPIAEINMGTSVYTTPVVANGVLFISTKDKLFAIATEEE
jgi:hypothetical protein